MKPKYQIGDEVFYILNSNAQTKIVKGEIEGVWLENVKKPFYHIKGSSIWQSQSQFFPTKAALIEYLSK